MICQSTMYTLGEHISKPSGRASAFSRKAPGSIPDASILRYEFYAIYGLVVEASACIALGNGLKPRQEGLHTRDIGRILGQSTFGSLDGILSTSSKGKMSMLYMYCERAVQNRQDVCAVRRRTASLQYNLVLYIQM